MCIRITAQSKRKSQYKKDMDTMNGSKIIKPIKSLYFIQLCLIYREVELNCSSAFYVAWDPYDAALHAGRGSQSLCIFVAAS